MENERSIVKSNSLLLQWKTQWTAIIVIITGLRIFYGVVGFWVISSGGPIPLQETVYEIVRPYLRHDLFSVYFVNPWFGWDTISYLKIAILGYANDATIAFMPLYPFLIRLFALPLAGNYLLGALVISTLCAAATLILMFELLRKYYPDEIAWRTTLFFIVFPTFFFLLAGYTESLFLMFVLASWLLAWKRHWLWAGIFAGLATLTRLQGVILSPVLLWMMLMSYVEQPSTDPFSQVRQALDVLKSLLRKRLNFHGMFSWFPILIPPLVAILHQTWLKSAGFGTISGALHTYWKLETVAPWTGFLLFLQRLPTRHFNYMDWIDLTLLILVLLAAILGLRRLDPAFSIYVWLTLAVLFTRGTPPHLLASFSRYFLGLFPLFILPALNPNRYQRLTAISLFFFFQVILVTIFLWGSWVA
jgi:hypothetical protein